MIGMDVRTGKRIDGEAHLAQSIADILTTPIGSRIERRDYGSLIPELIDQPFNAMTKLRLFGAAATALMRWEPRIQVTRLSLPGADVNGAAELVIEGRLTQGGVAGPARITVPLRASAH
ncbi:GPW/gp25 family protein [Stenotrophomonas sp. Iso1]|uniref:GPW/gp25 family protein n=1 Tax=Stenotrophomonas sp. Iso1 TaxID=2977283 RepID=UPI0022B7CFC6|nr:GPW/gp25 family protein [Stenotrophomonas sp. Iso1]